MAAMKPITAEELDHAKRLKIRNYGLQFESLGTGVTEAVVELWAAGLPFTDLQHGLDKLEAVDLAHAQEMVQKYYSRDKVHFLLVGDWKKVGKGVRALAGF